MSRNDNTTPYNAADYDKSVLKTIPFYEHLHDQAIDLVKTVIPSPRLWLDTGCGTGHLAERALVEFSQTRFVLADPSEAMLDQARQRLHGADPNRVSFMHSPTCEIMAIRLGQAPDVITAIMCHHYAQAEQRRKMTQVCRELLADGGVYITFENTRPDSDEAIRIGLQRWGRYQRSQGREDTAVEQHLARFDAEYFPITVSEHLRLLKDCGFEMAQLLWYSYMQAGFYAIK
jgi:tRNA (cmo5U34)-methyltransferase